MNPYEVLQVSESASSEVIRAAWTALVRQYHPDNKQTGNAKKTQAFNSAYAILKDPKKRADLDLGLAQERALKANSNGNGQRRRQRAGRTDEARYHNVPTVYPPAYGFSDEEIDVAIDDLVQRAGMHPIVGSLINAVRKGGK